MSSQLLVKPEEELQPNAAAPRNEAGVPCLSLTPRQRQLFSQSFVELSSTDRKRKRWTSASSFIVQALIVAFLVILPLWMTESLPMQQLATFLIAPPPPPPPPPPAAPTMKAPKVVSQVVNGQLLAPSRIPKEVKMIKEEAPPPPMQTGVVGGVEGGVPGGQVGGVIGSLLSTTSHTAPPVVAAPKRLRVSSGVSEGMLLKKVEPIYPVIAQRAQIQGSVQLRAIISKEGTIENLQMVSGHPMLAAAAIDAVKQWRYKPYILNGEPLEVETVVYVNFHLGM